MNRIAVILVCLLLASLNNYAQIIKTKPGYVVTLKGDTIEGRITNSINLNISEELELTVTGSEETMLIPTADVRCLYDSEDGLFIHTLITIDYSPIDFSDLRDVPEPDLRTEMGFVRCIRAGRISLYTFSKGIGRQLFFVAKENDSIIPLIDYTYFSDGYGEVTSSTGQNENENEAKKDRNSGWNQGPASIHLAKYKGQLSYLMSDWPEFPKYLKKLNYKQKDILDIVDLYNLYFDPSEKYSKPLHFLTDYRYGVSAAIGVGNLYFFKDNGTNVFYKPGMDIPFRAGAYLEVVPGRFRGRIKFQNHLGFDWYKSSGTKSYSQAPLQITDNFVFSPLSVILTNNLKFCLPEKQLTYYATAGVTNSFIATARNSLISESTLGQTTRQKEMDFVSHLRRYHLYYMLGVGIEFKSYSLEFRYDPAKELSSNVDRDIFHRALFLQLSYQFK
jgi:hypothetical protein